MQIDQHPFLSFAPLFMIDAHSAESNGKSIFLFLFFELWLIVYTIYGDTPSLAPTKKKVVKFTGKIHFALKMIF